ncbi:MAG: SH3 domain-containing protein [Candidatus Dojkabacteria bacterium]
MKYFLVTPNNAFKMCLTIGMCILLTLTLVSTTNAEFVPITPNYSTSIPENQIIKPIKKIVISPVKRRSVLSLTHTKFAREILYFMQKNGFIRSPVAYVLFRDSTVVELEKDWVLNDFSNSYDEGVLFVLLVYEQQFDMEDYRAGFRTLIPRIENALGSTNLTSVEDVELKDFVIEKGDEIAHLEFTEPEEKSDIRSMFAAVDFTKKEKPDLRVTQVDLPKRVEPQKTIQGKVTIENKSDFSFVFNESAVLEFKFNDNSVFHVNESWLNLRTAVSLDEGYILARGKKTFEVDLRAPLLPGSVRDTMRITFADTELSNQEIELEVADIGQKILRIEPTSLGYLYIRREPDRNSPEVGRAPAGLEFEYVEEQNGYYKIKYNNGFAWVYKTYVTILSR